MPGYGKSSRQPGRDISATAADTAAILDHLMVPFAHGQWLAAHVPDTMAHLETGQGHLSIMDKAFGGGLDEPAKSL